MRTSELIPFTTDTPLALGQITKDHRDCPVNYEIIGEGGRKLDYRSWTGMNKIMVASPLKAMVLFGSCFLLINLSFAAILCLDQDAVSNNVEAKFLANFFFSIQTFSTVGYGYYYPVSAYGNAVATLISFVGLSFVAMGTSVMFSAMSRPGDWLEFSRVAVTNQTIISGKRKC
jgi:inward rectifier potassium channel